jgi:hypothetical protein
MAMTWQAWAGRLLLGLALCAALSGSARAAALGGASADGVAAGTDPVLGCDTDGFTVTHVLSGLNVDEVIVDDIDAGCAGGELTVTLTRNNDNVLSSGGPVVVPGGGGSVTVDVNPDRKQSDINEHHLRVVGPA